MSIPKICALLESKLLALSPQLPTAFENVEFTPPSGSIYQRADHLINTPRDLALTLDVLQWRGVFQVLVCCPLGSSRVPGQTRAQAIADHFAPAQTLTSPGLRVELLSTPSIAQGFRSDDRWVIPVSINWTAYKT